jgi:hypothetical protein
MPRLPPNGNGSSSRDRLFWKFTSVLLVVMVIFGATSAAVVLFGSDSLALRMLNIFSGMFAGVLGLGTGYLLGSTQVVTVERSGAADKPQQQQHEHDEDDRVDE